MARIGGWKAGNFSMGCVYSIRKWRPPGRVLKLCCWPIATAFDQHPNGLRADKHGERHSWQQLLTIKCLARPLPPLPASAIVSQAPIVAALWRSLSVCSIGNEHLYRRIIVERSARESPAANPYQDYPRRSPKLEPVAFPRRLSLFRPVRVVVHGWNRLPGWIPARVVCDNHGLGDMRMDFVYARRIHPFRD